MTPMNPAMVEMVARARVAEMRLAAAGRSRAPWWRDTGHSRQLRPPAARRTVSIRPATPRRAIGWFLVSVGLRLALPRPVTSDR
jgi:hypothetical protein